ncbi:alpha/beta fold hydrolase [Georgenia ruanii]|nr:alpha/beta hydrolase [Georgenia ruanii]
MALALTTLTGRLRTAGPVLAVECMGSPAGRPVLLLPGGGQAKHSWADAAAVLAEAGYWAWSLDLRGHGDSEWAVDGNYTFEAHARDIASVVDQLPRPPVLVGASLGGLVSLLVAGEFRTSVAALVMVDAVPEVPAEAVSRIQQFMHEGRDGFATLDEVAHSVQSYRPDRSGSRDLERLRRNLRQREDGRWVWHWDPEYIAVDRTQTSSDIERFYRAAARLTVPSLLLRGETSDVVEVDAARALLDAAPAMEYAEIAGVGHVVTAGNNGQYAPRLLDFLAAHGL